MPPAEQCRPFSGHDPPYQISSTPFATEPDIKAALKEHRLNHSVVSVGLNALLLYPDHPWDIGDLYGYEYNPETERRERFVIASPDDLSQDFVYAKERRLIEIVKVELRAGRRCCHVYAVYTQKRDVTTRLANLLDREGIRVAVLTSAVPPEKRDAWFKRRLQEGVQVTISHPRIIETGMDSPWKANSVAKGCRRSNRTMICSRRWRESS